MLPASPSLHKFPGGPAQSRISAHSAFSLSCSKIYGTTSSDPFYRLDYRVAGNCVVRSIQTFTAAKKEAETKLREMAKGNYLGAHHDP